jgi:diguanylate cyclase (GGDEF)-like protein
MRKLNIGVIGLGEIAQKAYLPILTKETDWRLVGAFSQTRSRRRRRLDGTSVTISIGLHQYRPGMKKEELFKGADAALYQAKRTGKNKTVIYQESTYNHRPPYSS